MNGNGIEKMPTSLENKAENNLKISMGVGRVYGYDTPVHINKFPDKELNLGVLTGTGTGTGTEGSSMEVTRIYPNELSSIDPELAYQRKIAVFASDDNSLNEQPDLYTTPKQNQRRTSLLESSSVLEVSPSKDFSISSLPQARRGLDYCITAPVQRTLFLDSQEVAISKSMIERRGTPRPDLKLDRLSEHEKKKLIVNLVKIQSDGTVEVDLTKGAHEASELLELHPDEAIPPPTDYIITGYDKPIPKLNIALLIVGTRGDVQPFLAIARRLQEFGHRVRLATHSNFSGFVKLAGVGFYPLGGDPRVLAGYMARNKGLIPSGPREITMQRKQIKAIIESLLPACTEPDPVTGEPFRAQAIIANPPAYGHAHVAEALGVPLHIFFTMPWTPTYAFPHPLARVPQSAAYWLSYILVDLLIWWGIRSYVNDFRKNKLKLAPLAYFSTYRGSISHLPTGYMWSPNVVPKPNDWGPLVDVVGYCFLNLGTKYEPTEEFIRWIKKGDEPIYIGFGSMPLEDSKKTTVIILEALKNTGQRGIIDRGWGNLGTHENIPDDVFLLVDCPHDRLFPQCSAVVHHGGAGTTATGLRAGCPTTIVPFFGDQFFWGERVYQKGLGPAPIPISQLNVKSLSEAIRFMLQPEVKSRVTELAVHIQNEDGVGAAVDAFHRHLPPELPLPTPPPSEKDETPNPLQWIFTQIGRLCCLPCGGIS
ncbi:sterol 3-beta-glucosyltransferase UGT80B1-like isoform X2 [Primulina tabacum]|uniref:sterol 3-beta-glucosyltransferase UGT80B1-like isoform X2 n=1 Tax=Primulina tabacum TaxID=48773 RepID=UPI003F59CA5F